MSAISIYVAMPDYLRQWLTHDCGGTEPLVLPRGSIESCALRVMLAKRPKDQPPTLRQPGDVAIAIPTIKGKPAEYWNHLTERGRRFLVQCCKDRFDIDLWTSIHSFETATGGKRIDEMIYCFMEARGIEPTEKNFNSVKKRYDRRRAAYYRSRYRRENKK